MADSEGDDMRLTTGEQLREMAKLAMKRKTGARGLRVLGAIYPA